MHPTIFPTGARYTIDLAQSQLKAAKYIEEEIPKKSQLYFQGFVAMVNNLIVKNEQLAAQLHDHLKAENSILLNPEYETFKHLVDIL